MRRCPLSGALCGLLVLFGSVAAALLDRPAAAQEPQFKEHVEVQTVMLEVRVVDSKNGAVRGLVADDFKVTVGGKPVTLDPVAWEGAPDRESIADRLLAGEDVSDVKVPPPRLIVLFYQLDIENSRIVGQIRMANLRGELIDSLNLDDKVAVVAFSSRLRVLLDFTTDRDALTEATKATSLNTDLPRPRRTGSPSLVDAIDWPAAAKAAEPETGLLVTARALESIPGAKTMLLFGWGLGHLTRSGVEMGADYDAARRALARSHTTVFALDVTNADRHSLEVGLEQVAADTGGTYSKTNEFPGLALDRVERALVGHYVLSFARPDLPDGVYLVKVELTRKRADVLYQGAVELRR